jgi:hypothetical protein
VAYFCGQLLLLATQLLRQTTFANWYYNRPTYCSISLCIATTNPYDYHGKVKIR